MVIGGQLTKYTDDDAGRPGPGGPVKDGPAQEGPAAHPPDHRWLDRRHLMAVYAAFAAYAAAAAAISGGEDQVWAIWAACGYAVALFMLWRWRGVRVLIAAVLVSVALAVLAPLLWLSVAYPLEAGMTVIDRSAALLLHHGSPYLSAAQVTSWLSYNPYLPVMTLFGLPSAAGLGGLAGNSGVWIALGTVVLLGVAFWIAVPARGDDSARSRGGSTPPNPPGYRPRQGTHRGCPPCRRDALLATAVAVASPVVGLNLAVITTDPPVLALIVLALALAARPAGTSRAAGISRAGGPVGAGVALGVACDLKSTAWLAVPVLAAMFTARDGARAAGRFVAASVATVVILVAALAPAALTSLRSAEALVQNSVLFPLGLTRYKTPAESLLPGHLLTALGPAGHVVSVGLLLAAGLGIAVSLVIRPPRDVPAAAWRLAVGLALMFLLGPNVRFGYFIYPLGLIGWLALNARTLETPTAPAGARAPAGLAEDLVDDR